MPASIDVADLVMSGARWRMGGRDLATGVDCLWAVQEVQRRRGLVVPPEADLNPCGDSSRAVLDDYLARAGCFWLPVPAATELGDVLQIPGAAGRPHVMAVVEVGRYALACTRKVGLHLVRYTRVRPETVFRYRPPPP